MTSRRERILEQLVVTPGRARRWPIATLAGRAARTTRDSREPELKAEAKAVLSRGVEELSDAQELLWASDTLLAAGRPAGDGRGRQGQHDQARHVRRQPAGRPGRLVQDALARRSSTTTSSGASSQGRCRSAAGSASSTARTTRRSSRSACIPEWLEQQRLPAALRGDGVLGGALRGHQRLRAPPRPQRDEDRQVLPQRLEGRAEAALPRAARQARQGVEVLRGRRRRAGALGRLHGGLRGRP